MGLVLLQRQKPLKAGEGKGKMENKSNKQLFSTGPWAPNTLYIYSLSLRTLLLLLEGSGLAPVLLKKKLYIQGGHVLVCTQALRPMSFLDSVGGKEGCSELSMALH